VGIPLTHGIVKDLFDKLSLRPKFVEVLGNGFQRKQYIHVSELVRLMILMRQGVQSNYEIFNIAPIDDGIFIKFIAESLRDLISPSTELKYGDTDYGWKGDVPRYFLDTSKLVREGFEVTINSEEAVRITLEEIESLLHD
jgi:UDP-glucose 4-epimerase